MSFSIGAPEGWRQEDRPLQRVQTPDGWDYLELSVVCRGEHLETCQAVDEGWVCDDGCPVEDMPRIGQSYLTIVDEIIEVREVVHRRRCRLWRLTIPTPTIEWSATRVSVRNTFINGRRHMSQKGTYSYDPLYLGTAKTKRGARRKMKQAIEADQVMVG